MSYHHNIIALERLLTFVFRGHSFPRTHRGHDAKFPGMAITYALMQVRNSENYIYG